MTPLSSPTDGLGGAGIPVVISCNPGADALLGLSKNPNPNQGFLRKPRARVGKDGVSTVAHLSGCPAEPQRSITSG